MIYDINILFPHISEIPHRKILLKVINILVVIEHVLIPVDNSFNTQECKQIFKRIGRAKAVSIHLTFSLLFSQPGAMGLHNLIGKLKKWIKILEEKAKLLPK